MPGNTGGDLGLHKPVHETTTDSRAGENEGGDSVVHAAPRHRLGMDARGVSADAQGWSAWHRRCDGGGLRGEPGDQSVGPPGAHQVRPLRRPAGAPGLHSESGWLATAARHPDIRGQGGTAGDRHGAGGHLRAGLPVLLVRLPAGTVGASGPECIAPGLHGPEGAALGVGRRHLQVLRHHPTSSPACVPRQTSSRTASFAG